MPKKTSLRHRVPDADAGLLSFVSFLLAVDPRKRPSAQEALQHPWLQVGRAKSGCRWEGQCPCAGPAGFKRLLEGLAVRA